MNEVVDKVKNDIETFLMEDMDNQEMKVEFILLNPKQMKHKCWQVMVMKEYSYLLLLQRNKKMVI